MIKYLNKRKTFWLMVDSYFDLLIIGLILKIFHIFKEHLKINQKSYNSHLIFISLDLDLVIF
jgi:hypothetical protein